MDGGGVSQAVEGDHLFGKLQTLFGGIRFEHCQYGREFFAGQRLVGADFAAFGDDDVGFFRHFKPCLLGNPRRRFAHHGGIEFRAAAVRAVCRNAKDEVFEHGFFFFVGEVHAVGFELFDQLFINLFVGNDGLFAGANHAVVERLGHHDVVCRLLDVCRFFDIGRHVARPDAERGFAAGISGFHHRIAAGRQNRRHARMFHQRGSAFHRRFFNPLDAVFRRAGGNRSIAHDLGGVGGTLLGGRVERENNRIAGFQRNQGFENGGGSRIGGRHDTADDPDRIGDFGNAGYIVFADDAHGFQIAQAAYHIFAGKQVFGCLVFKYTASRFFDRVHGEYTMFVQRGNRGFGDNIVDLLLIQRAEFFQSLQTSFNQPVDFGNGRTGGMFGGCVHDVSP